MNSTGMKLEIFTYTDARIQEQVNEWLASNDVNIVRMNETECEESYTVYIWYRVPLVEE